MARQTGHRAGHREAAERRVRPAQRRAPGQAPELDDLDRSPVVEPGVGVEPEELGVQFLRDATEQGNFESEEVDGGASGLERQETAEGQLISDASLEAAQQEGEDAPFSGALGDAAPVPREPREPELDLRQDSVRSASLFDQPYADDEEPPDSELELPLQVNTRRPHIQTDDPSEVDEARQREIKRLFDERVQKRLQRERGRRS